MKIEEVIKRIKKEDCQHLATCKDCQAITLGLMVYIKTKEEKNDFTLVSCTRTRS